MLWYEISQGRSASTISPTPRAPGRAEARTAEEAAAAGAVNRVAPAGALLDTARELAAMLNANPPLSVRSTVRARRREIARVRAELSAAAQPERLYLTEDFHEAALAFKEKRAPRPFKGR